jgi:NhaP-type Na+/H+ or K+/H+ antiporter
MTAIAVFLLLVFLFGLVSHRVERTIITAPMVFTAAGLLLALALPDQFQGGIKTKPALLLTEIALTVVLFTDASRINLRALAGSAGLPARLLGIGMPLTILAGTVLAALLFTDLTVWEAAILAAVLAPTDAGLGHAVMSSPRVPARIRQALNVEAGLNDGLSVPILMLFIALAQVNSPLHDRSWIGFTLGQIGYGLLVGLVVGWAGSWLMGQANRRGWIAETFQQLCLLSLAVVAWRAAEVVGGNGFVAAFVGGLVVKIGFETAGERMIEFSESWGQLLNISVFFLFGLLTASVLGAFNTMVVLYALLSLTVIRMLPVAVALVGARLQPVTVLFLGWFGPRGLASIVLGLIFLEQKADLRGEPLIELVVTATVILSVFAHGITAAPTIGLYARQVEAMDSDAPERQEVVEMPVR